MDRWTWLTTGGASVLVAFLGYLKRGKIRQGLSASWVARRLNVERDLIRCRAEIADMAASFSRQRVDMAAELATRDRERVYLLSLVEEMTSKANKVAQAHDRGLLSVSAAPLPTPARRLTASPRLPRKRASSTTDRSRSRPIRSNGNGKRGAHET